MDNRTNTLIVAGTTLTVLAINCTPLAPLCVVLFFMTVLIISPTFD